MKEDLYDDLYEEKEEKIDFHALLFRYVIRWPWFVASVIICLAGAWLHLRQTTPVYNISASVIIKDDKKGGNSGGNLAALEGLGLVNSVSNIDNEIEILRSKTLVKHVVSELNLYTTYSVKVRRYWWGSPRKKQTGCRVRPYSNSPCRPATGST